MKPLGVTVENGSRSELVCEFRIHYGRKDDLIVQWWHDNDIVVPREENLKVGPIGRATLIIELSTPKNEGVYTCKGTFNTTEISATLTLTVNGEYQLLIYVHCLVKTLILDKLSSNESRTSIIS